MSKPVTTGGDGFFDGLFGKRKLVKQPLENNDTMHAALEACQPQLLNLVREARKFPGDVTKMELGVMADGKPCTINISIVDNVLPSNLPPELKEDIENAHPANTPRTPKDDLVASVESMLRAIYKEQDVEILGAVYSPHHSAAMKVGEILEVARDQDRKHTAKAIIDFLKTLKY